MTTAAELKDAHLEQIKAYLKDYVSTGKEVHFGQPDADSFSDYVLTENGLYTGGYAPFKSIDGDELKPLLMNNNYKGSDFSDSHEILYSNEDFYQHLQYALALRLLSSIKE